MSELSAWLPPLEPPPGGYARLSLALDARRLSGARHTWRARLLLAGSCLAIIALALATLLHQPDPQVQMIGASLRQAWAQGDQELVITDGAAAELLKAPGLRVYWVGVVTEPAESGVR